LRIANVISEDIADSFQKGIFRLDYFVEGIDLFIETIDMLSKLLILE